MVLAGLISGAAGLLIAVFLHAIVANTPVRVRAHTLFWSTVLFGATGLVAGMALESVRQLQQASPEPDYHRHRSLRRRAAPPPRGTDSSGAP